MDLFDLNFAKGVAADFWRDMGNEVTSLSCLRFGQNGVFHDSKTDLVVRVHRPTRSFDEVSKELFLASFLASKGFLTTQPAEKFGGIPYLQSGIVISVWHYVDSIGGDKNLYELALLVRKFHGITDKLSEDFPRNPWLKLSKERLERFLLDDRFDDNIINQIIYRTSALEKIFSEPLKTSLGRGVLHGDAHIGNVIKSAHGLVLTDYERVCYDAREWDAVPTIVALRRFGNRHKDFEDFARGFGGDILNHEFLDLMCEVREFFMLTAIMELKGSNSIIDKSIEYQTQTLLDGDRLAPWRAHW